MEEELCEDFDEFSKLPISLQKEAIREGEARLQAQLAVAAAADARGIAWGGLLTAAVTASLGAGIALMSAEKPDYALAVLAICFAAALLMASGLAISTVAPEEFDLPGNTPTYWLPPNWGCAGSARRMEARARLEQAECLANAVKANRDRAALKAKNMKRSFAIAFSAIGLGSFCLFAIIITRFSDQIILARTLLAH